MPGVRLLQQGQVGPCWREAWFPGHDIKWIPKYEICLPLYTAVSVFVKFGSITIGIFVF